LFMALCSLVLAQGTQPATSAGASASATKAEVDQLRSEVAAQRQTIEELKAMVQKLVEEKASANSAVVRPEIRPVADTPTEARWPANANGGAAPRLTDAVLREVAAEPVVVVDQAAPAAAPKKEPPLSAGWSGEHFFIRSADGQFNLSPYGYLNDDYRAYQGDGAPSDTFVLRNARFGFQGSYGSHFDFALLADAAASTGAIVRDVYLNVRIKPELQFQAGQFKIPFSQETGIGDTNLDFVERGFQSLIYPASSSTYRSPGVTLHGDISGGVVQYWAGAFNGRGYATNNATNEPEFVGRLRFYPFRKSASERLKQFAFGGSIDHARSRGLSGDTSFTGTIPDAAYTFFPSLRINGPVERYAGEFTYITGPLALRGEYVQAIPALGRRLGDSGRPGIPDHSGHRRQGLERSSHVFAHG